MKKFLFVCMGNTCRSPMAEGIFRKLFVDIGVTDVVCDSAGWATNGGESANTHAKDVCAEIGVDLTTHISKGIAQCDLDEYDKIIFADALVGKAALRADIDPEKVIIMNHGLGIDDPYGWDSGTYRKVRQIIVDDFFDILALLCGIEIVKMNQNHIKQIAQIEKQSFSRPWSEDGLREEIDNPNAYFFAAQIGNNTLGYAGMHCVLDEGFIANIAVSPVFREKGVASALIDKLEETAHKKRLYRLTLEVRKTNAPAISLYKKYGFVEDGARKNFYSEPTEDALIMSKYFK